MQPVDMLVDLYQIDFKQQKSTVTINRVLSPDSDNVVKFIEQNFNASWASEAKAALYKTNPSCFIAVDNKKIIGFACYDATAKGFFGPEGVDPNYRGKGVGKALLLHWLETMRFEGYAYAIIGGMGSTRGFYEKVCNAIPIENSRKVYNRLASRS